MRIALISDIHANFEALKSLSDVLTDADCLLCLGDLVGYYCQVNEVIEYLREMNALCILGNHDSFLLNGYPGSSSDAIRFGIEYANRVITSEHRQWLNALPLVWGGTLGGRSFLLSHGSPWRPLTDYLYPDNPALEQLAVFDYDVIVFGQTHWALEMRLSRTLLLNPGSVGQSRHIVAQACAMLLDTESMAVSWIARAYDPHPVIRWAQQNGAGDWVYKHLI